MADLELRPLRADDRAEVAELICAAFNHWYQAHALPPIFDGPRGADGIYEVYHKLEGSGAVVAVDGWSGRLAGCCFHHERPTHVSLGIMSVHPNHARRGVGGRLVRWITDLADGVGKPVRLVSSAMNLDSFSLYTRAGFVARRTFQDVRFAVPEAGFAVDSPRACRPAQAADVDAMAALELELSGISRPGDFGYFLDNPDGFWHVSACPAAGGGLDGFLASSAGMLGPGVARDEEIATALLLAELDRRRGGAVIGLLPVDCGTLVQRAYAWGGRNTELHVLQVRGACPPLRGVTLPTFMPETG